MQGEIRMLDGLKQRVPKQAIFQLVVFAQTFHFDQWHAHCWQAHALLGFYRAAVHKIVNHRQALRAVVQARAASNQRLGVGIFRIVKNGVHIPRFPHLAVAHDNHLVRDFTHQPEIVADEQHAHTVLLLQLGNQVGHLALYRHVQRSRGLIGNQKLGLASNGNGDHHALLLSPGEFVGVGFETLFGVGDTHLSHQLQGPIPGLPRVHSHVNTQDLSDLLTHREHRVERAHRLLEHH